MSPLDRDMASLALHGRLPEDTPHVHEYRCSCGDLAPLNKHLAFCGGGEFCVLDDCLCDCHIPREYAHHAQGNARGGA